MTHLSGTTWPTATISRLFDLRGGTTPSADEGNWNGPVPWVTPVDLRPVHGGYVSGSSRTLSAAGAASVGLVPAPAGSIVLSCRAPVGYVAVSTLPVTTNQGCKSLVATTDVDARYFRYQLEVFRDALEVRGRGSTFVEISSQTVADFPVVAPTLDTQRRIADMLDAETARIDTLIAKNQRVIELLKLRLRAEVLRVLTGGDAVSVVGKAPVTYAETARLGLVVDTQLGKMLTSKPDIGLRETPYVKASDVLHDGTVRLSGLDTMYASAQERRELSLRTDDVLIIEGGATAGKAARVGDQPTEGIIFQNHVHRLRSRGMHVQPFLYWCMKAYEWTGWYDAYCFVTTFKGLPTGKLRSLPLPVLSINDQRRIVGDIEERADDHERLTRLVEKQNGLLRTRRQALITAAVTGERAV